MIKEKEDTLLATCTPPHDIPGKAIAEFLPEGPGSDLLRELMARSELVLRDHRECRTKSTRRYSRHHDLAFLG
jgi:2,3-bisphosphoglycerate-independent phosphoglycerate mutase